MPGQMSKFAALFPQVFSCAACELFGICCSLRVHMPQYFSSVQALSVQAGVLSLLPACPDREGLRQPES